MGDKKNICPMCNSTVTFFGEGGYGRCTNDKCRFETKTDNCKVPGCDDYELEHETIEHDPEL